MIKLLFFLKEKRGSKWTHAKELTAIMCEEDWHDRKYTTRQYVQSLTSELFESFVMGAIHVLLQ